MCDVEMPRQYIWFYEKPTTLSLTYIRKKTIFKFIFSKTLHVFNDRNNFPALFIHKFRIKSLRFLVPSTTCGLVVIHVINVIFMNYLQIHIYVYWGTYNKCPIMLNFLFFFCLKYNARWCISERRAFNSILSTWKPDFLKKCRAKPKRGWRINCWDSKRERQTTTTEERRRGATLWLSFNTNIIFRFGGTQRFFSIASLFNI